VGIERVCARSAQRKELCCEFKGNRITEDSGRLCQEGIEQVQRVHRRNPELLNVLWRRYSTRRASRKCADRHRGEENSLSSGAEGRVH
jgi:hypothetical protein